MGTLKIEEERQERVRGYTKSIDMCNSLWEYDAEKEAQCDAGEPILDAENERAILKPINPRFQKLWDNYQKQFGCIWTPQSIDFGNDAQDFALFDENTKTFIKKILAFFASADSIVNVNISTNLSKIKVTEAKVGYQYQTMMENVHAEVYSDMLMAIVPSEREKNDLITNLAGTESVNTMMKWGNKWISSGRRIAFSIVSFVIFEGLMFSSAFLAIYWLRQNTDGKRMKGLFGSNEYIARDEGLHTLFGCAMYEHVVHKLTNDEMIEMMREAVDVTKDFACDALPVKLIGINSSLVGAYIENVADRLLVQLGYAKLYGTQLPTSLSFMEQIGISNKSNFFERRSTDYQNAHNDANRNWKMQLEEDY